MAEFKIRDKKTGEVFTIREKKDSKKDNPVLDRAKTFAIGGVAPAAAGVSPGAALEAQKSIYSPETAQGLFEGATLGLPRHFLSQKGIDVPRGNIGGQIAGFALGPGKVIGALGKTAIPGSGIVSSSIRGGLEGAAGGFAFPQEDFTNMTNRTLLAGGGGIIGAGLGLIGGAYGAFQKVRQARQAIRESEKQKFLFKGSQQVERPSEIQRGIKALNQRKSNLIKQEKSAFDEQIKTVTENINKEAQSQAQLIKEPTLNYMKRFKSEWGESFDDALREAPEQGINYKELQGIKDETIKELTEIGIDPKGSVIGTIDDLVGKFKPQDQVVKETVRLPNDLGTPVTQSIERVVQGNKIVSNLDLVKVRRGVQQSLSSGAKRGQFSEEDIAGAIFNSKLADRISSNVPRLQELNSSYKSFSDLAKFTYKTFKPRASEYEIGTGSNILRKFATGKANQGEVSAIRELEKNIGIKFTQDLEKMKGSLDKLKSMKPESLARIEAKFSRAIRNMEKTKLSISKSNKQEIRRLDEKIFAAKELLDDMATIRKVGTTIGMGALIAGSGLLFGNVLGKNIRQALDVQR